MPRKDSHLESRLLATAAMGLVLAVAAPYRDADAANICGNANAVTIINTPQLVTNNCFLSNGESVDIRAMHGIG